MALRSLGVPLARIARALGGDGFTLKDAVTAQLGAVDAQLGLAVFVMNSKGQAERSSRRRDAGRPD